MQSRISTGPDRPYYIQVYQLFVDPSSSYITIKSDGLHIIIMSKVNPGKPRKYGFYV